MFQDDSSCVDSAGWPKSTPFAPPWSVFGLSLGFFASGPGQDIPEPNTTTDTTKEIHTCKYVSCRSDINEILLKSA